MPRRPLPVRELDQLLRLLIRLQRRWLRQRRKHDLLLNEMRRLAFEDALTGLPNRNALIRRFDQGELRPPFSFALLDIVDFRAFNDTYGADTGDALLKKIATTIVTALDDIPRAQTYRVGSDEFVIVLPNIEPETARLRLKELIWRIRTLTLEKLTGRLNHVQVRMGLTHVKTLTTIVDSPTDRDDGQAFSACMIQADAALLEAKKRQQALMDFTLLDEVRAPLLDHALGTFIDRAVRTGEGLRLFAQPIVARENGQVLYHELLVRAAYEGRTIQPAELFEWIDRHHLHRSLDEQVVRLAAELLARGEIPPGQGISLNLCEQTLMSTDDMVALLAPLHPFVAERPITIEVLESVLMKRLDVVREQLSQLTERGYRIALDDFGSGYASFRYLAQLPITTVKIDRSLLAMLESPLLRERELFEQLCRMLAQAEFSVIIEGVESERQCERLCPLPIVGLQGYLFSRPEPSPVLRVERPCPPLSP